MHAISTSSATAAYVAPLPAAPNEDFVSGDALAAMRPAMDTAFAVGRPTDAGGAATVMATGASYLQGAGSTIAKLDEGIAKRTKEIEQLRHIDPNAAQDKQTQLDMLQRLRDRIQLSIERVSDILAGKDRDDIGTEGVQPAMRAEQLDLLEQRRQLLAPAGADALGAGARNSTVVAGAYAQATGIAR